MSLQNTDITNFKTSFINLINTSIKGFPFKITFFEDYATFLDVLRFTFSDDKDSQIKKFQDTYEKTNGKTIYLQISEENNETEFLYLIEFDKLFKNKILVSPEEIILTATKTYFIKKNDKLFDSLGTTYPLNHEKEPAKVLMMESIMDLFLKAVIIYDGITRNSDSEIIQKTVDSFQKAMEESIETIDQLINEDQLEDLFLPENKENIAENMDTLMNTVDCIIFKKLLDTIRVKNIPSSNYLNDAGIFFNPTQLDLFITEMERDTPNTMIILEKLYKNTLEISSEMKESLN